MNPRVIIINGPSCVGKTSIAKEICKQSGDKFVHLQIDEFKKLLFTILNKDQRHNGRNICDNIMLNTAQELINNKFNIVIDTIFNEESGAILLAKKHLDFFKNYEVLFVGIDCPLEIRLKRFHEHNDNILRNEKAIIAGCNDFVLCKELYNLWFDSSELSAKEIASKLLVTHSL